MPAPLSLCVLLYNCNAVGSWGSADGWRCVKSRWLESADASRNQFVFSADHILASHRGFSGLVKSQVRQPEVNRSCCCFSTTIQLSQRIPVRYSWCKELPAAARQRSPALHCFSGLQKSRQVEAALFAVPYKDNRAFKNSNPPLKDPWGSLGRAPSTCRQDCLDASLGLREAANGAFHQRWINGRNGSGPK